MYTQSTSLWAAAAHSASNFSTFNSKLSTTSKGPGFLKAHSIKITKFIPLQTFSFGGNCSLLLGYLWYLLEFGIVLFCRKIVRANNWILHLQIYSFLLIEMRSIFANTHPHESISRAYFWKENPPLIKCHSMTIHLSQTKISLNRFLQRWVALKNVMTFWKLCSCWPGPCSCCGRSRE